MHLPTIIKVISHQLSDLGARAIVVGGSVRDHFLALPIKDYDVEVYGLSNLNHLISILKKYGSVNLVGKSFGVLKFTNDGEEYDFSFPRRDSKTGAGHKGFDVEVDGSLCFTEAARRRDFTINALGYSVEEEAFIDPFGGIDDLKDHCLRHISDDTFVEDPLRVYRAIQFAGRFGFTLADETFTLCQSMVKRGLLEELPRERVFMEWQKLLLKSPSPSVGFEVMRSIGIIKKHFPELNAIINVPQSPKWHPEGDVWTHTMLALDKMAEGLKGRSGESEKRKLMFLLTILLHDLGKATHTRLGDDGNIHSKGHEKAGVEPAMNLLSRLTNEKGLVESIIPLIEHHLKPSLLFRGGAGSRAIRRLANKVNIEDLVFLARADFLGRTTEESLSGVYRAGDWLLEKAKELHVSGKPLECVIQGRDLIELGMEPSPEFKAILTKVLEKQMDGDISTKEEGISFVQLFLSKKENF